MKDNILEIIEICLEDARQLVKIADGSSDEYFKRKAYEDLHKWEAELANYQAGGI